MLRRNEIETAYAALFEPNATKFSVPHSKEHCSANGHQIGLMGLKTGQQARIERPTENGTTLALYTISDAHGEEPNSVFLDYKNPEDVGKRFGVPTEEPFQGKINSQVAAVGLDDDAAKAYSEFVEHLTDDGHNSELVVIAPHGGDIEEHTGEQAEEVAKQLSSTSVSVWMCKGFKKGHGAFDRWHITATDIYEKSLPMLKTIFGRHFKYAVAFHGWSGDSICIGGSKEDPDNLKKKIKKAIYDVVSGSGIVVEIAGDDDNNGLCPEGFNGNSQNNIVNRLGATGVQIEQCEKARDNYGPQIAKAVANVIRPKLVA
jgi:phage replication-related protein YjqB (UPF0714/DUF867 family)